MPSTQTAINKKDIADIVQLDHPVLRQKAEAVSLIEIQSEKIQSLIEKMKKVLAKQKDGIGLAAPQIGVGLRIFIVSGKVLLPPEERVEVTSGKTASTSKVTIPPDMVFINPEIIKESKEKKWMEGEGCLSVRWLYGKVRRSTKVTLRAYNEHGQIIERGASGIMAHIFQHEVDHLNGILFIDKAKDIEELHEEDRPKSK